MSTRANITIKNGESKIILYRHYDGYPTNAGIDIANRIKRSKDTSALVSDFLTASFDAVNGTGKAIYEITTEIHGDIEYDYEITVPKFGYNFYHRDIDGNYTNMPTVTVKERKLIETLDNKYLVSWTTIHENETHDTLLPIWSRAKDKELVTFTNGKKVNELIAFGIEAADVKEARERLKKDEY